MPRSGKEYFDVFYGRAPAEILSFCLSKAQFQSCGLLRGIDPLAWAFCGFVIVYYGAVLKNAAQKCPDSLTGLSYRRYNIPISKRPPKIGGFVGKDCATICQ